jgi:hypothetical protein
VAGYGPLMLHVYGVTEDTIRTTWTLGQFRRYRDFALEIIKARGGP